jgi:hypothetical protein
LRERYTNVITNNHAKWRKVGKHDTKIGQHLAQFFQLIGQYLEVMRKRKLAAMRRYECF